MLDNIWDYLNIWIRKKLKDSFTTDGDGNTAIRVVGDLEVTSDNPNVEDIINISLPSSSVEYVVTLPTETRRYTIYCRNDKKLSLAYNSGETDSNYLTIHPGETHDSGRVDYVNNTDIYLKAFNNGVEVELKVQRRL
jgi:hypothetical protein